MNSSNHHDGLDALFAAARVRRPDTSTAEFAFETRLMSHLRAERETGSISAIWALVSWRLIPFFAAAVVAMAIWQVEVSSDTSDAAAFAQVDNPDGSDLLISN
jgi:hypothetical protein